MNRISVALAATVMLLLILPFCASGEATIPYIDLDVSIFLKMEPIEYPCFAWR